MSEVSEFDKANIGKIIQGHGDWFSAYLFRLIAKADPGRRERIRLGFPEHVEVFERWEREE